MPFSLVPQEFKFFDYLDQQAGNLTKAAGYFKSAIKDGVLDESEVRKIRELEQEGDTLAHEITDMLNRTFITPIDREDIYALANNLDDILDLLNAMAGRVSLYKLAPNDEHFARFIDLIEASAAALASAIRHMPDSSSQRSVLDRCVEINRLENLGDSLREKAIARLFEQEKDPVTVLKWKEIYESAESALDECEHAAKLVESILVKNR